MECLECGMQDVDKECACQSCPHERVHEDTTICLECGKWMLKELFAQNQAKIQKLNVGYEKENHHE